MFKKWHLLFCIALLVFSFGYAQQTDEQFTLRLNYLLAMPDGYGNDTSKQWPLLIFLHGSGESGEDLSKVKVHGPPKLIEQGRKLPFIVVSPQANRMYGWQPEVLQHLLNDLKKQLRIDLDRIYLTGLSMGGYGTWNWATKYPKQFAAIVPICGGGDSSEAKKLRNVSVWCFHGAKDMSVPVDESYKMINALKRHNPTAKLTIYPDAGHDSWTETYNNDSLYTWLLSKQRHRFKSSDITASKLREYAGAYSRTGKDTLMLVVENNKLVAKTGGPDVEIKHINGESFFFQEGDDQFEINFVRNRRKQIEKMRLYVDDLIEFKKL